MVRGSGTVSTNASKVEFEQKTSSVAWSSIFGMVEAPRRGVIRSRTSRGTTRTIRAVHGDPTDTTGQLRRRPYGNQRPVGITNNNDPLGPSHLLMQRPRRRRPRRRGRGRRRRGSPRGRCGSPGPRRSSVARSTRVVARPVAGPTDVGAHDALERSRRVAGRPSRCLQRDDGFGHRLGSCWPLDESSAA